MGAATQTRGFHDIGAHKLNPLSNPRYQRLVIVPNGERFFCTRDPKSVFDRILQVYEWTDWMVPTINSRFQDPGGLFVCFPDTKFIDTDKPDVASVTIEMLKTVAYIRSQNLVFSIYGTVRPHNLTDHRLFARNQVLRASFVFDGEEARSFSDNLNDESNGNYGVSFYDAEGMHTTPDMALAAGSVSRIPISPTHHAVIGELVVLKLNLRGEIEAHAYALDIS
jgi:hypothetical protein